MISPQHDARFLVGRLLVILWVAAQSDSAWADPDVAWSRFTIDDSDRGADGVRLADANGDGLLDIVTPWEESGIVKIYLNPGPARVKRRWPAVVVGRVASPEDAVLVDLDGDGRLDVVTSCEGRNKTIFVHWAPTEPSAYLQPAAWRTAAINCTADAQAWMMALPLQVDGKHGIDLVVGSKRAAAAVGWLEAPDRPRDLGAWKYHRIRNAGWIMSIMACDMDADGDPDVLISDRYGPQRGVWWLEGNRFDSPGGGTWHARQLGLGDREVMFLAYPEKPHPRDIYGAVNDASLFRLQAPSVPNEVFRYQEISISQEFGIGKAVAVGDVDLDGRADIVFTCEEAHAPLSGVGWLPGAEGFVDSARSISGQDGVKFDLVELLDLDGDGDLDVLTCEERTGLGVVWYENPTL